MKAIVRFSSILACGLALGACRSGTDGGSSAETLIESSLSRVYLDKASAEDFEAHSVACKDKKKDTCVVICHVPPGNADAKHTIKISTSAIDTHLEHGSNGHPDGERDYLGECHAAAGSDDSDSGSGDSSGGSTDSGDDGSSGGDSGTVDSGSSDDGATAGGTDSGVGSGDTGSGSNDSSSGDTGSTDGSDSTGGSSGGSIDDGSSSSDGSASSGGGNSAPTCQYYPITSRDQNCDGMDDVTGDLLY